VKGRRVAICDDHVGPQGAQATTIRCETRGEPSCKPRPRNESVDFNAPEVAKQSDCVAAREYAHVVTVRAERWNEGERAHRVTATVPVHEVGDTH
jgi:hypothetical protein